MTTVIPFRPSASLRAEGRVDAFIELARKGLANALIPDAEYDSPSWNVTSAFVVKSSKGEHWLHFLSERLGGRKRRVQGTPLASPFLEFAKASIRYRHAAAPLSYNRTHFRLQALRQVEAAFLSLGRKPEIWALDALVLNRAMEATSNDSDHKRYQFGNGLEALLAFCRELRLLTSDVAWRCQVRKPREVGSRIGQEFADRRAKRLPSAAAFDALASIFRNPQTEADLIYSSVAAICCGVPIRAHEVLQLPLACEVEAEAPEERADDTDGAVDGAARRTVYGLRVWPGKGNVPQVKWVPEVFADVVREAIRRLQELCASARKVAAWYEDNPRSIWLPEEMEHLRSVEWLTVPEVQGILGLPTLSSAAFWLDRNQVTKRLSERRGKNVITHPP